MATQADTPEIRVVRRRHPALSIAKWTGIALLGFLFLFGALIVWLNTDPGRRFIVNQINAFETASGLQVRVGRIEGSVFGEMTLHDVSLADPQGIFFRAPRVEIDYRPFAYTRNHIDIRAMTIPVARIDRLPALRPGDPDAPLLPDIDIDVGRLRIERLWVAPAVTGQRHLLQIDSRAHIASGRAEVALELGTVVAPGLAGGDRLSMRLDATPEQNRFDLELAMRGPANGFVAGVIGVDRAVAARISGRGDWDNWRGRAQAGLGGAGLFDLAVTARNGTFSVTGPVRPQLVMQGPVERLAGDRVQLNLVTTFENRRADLRLRLGSEVLAIAAEGLVDLGQNRFENLRVATRLLQPGVIAPDLSGRGVQLAMILNGAFATPSVAYELRAERLTFDTTTVVGLRAVGSARVRADDIIVPVSARAQRILGFEALAGGPINNVRLDGDLGIAGTRLVTDNLRLRSDRIDATLALAFDFSTGRYLAGIQGRMNNFLIDGVGLIDLTTNLDMVGEANGFSLRGRVAARTRRIDNSTIADLLGGPATLTANIAVQSSGLVTFDNVRVASPRLRVTSGSGVYRPDGTIDMTLAGVSEDYGALVVRVTGTPTAPNVRLTAANPGFGIGLRNVEASVRAVAGGWALQATGDSDYGPFSADVVVRTGGGPLTIDIARLTFAGIDFQGRVVQTAAGPFAGTLTLVGQGLNGTVQLGAEGRYQRIEIAATANGARTPGEVPILIQRGLIRATVILTPTPSIVGDAQLAGLSSGDLFVDRARLRINYQGGNGQAQLFAEGRRGVAFRVAANTTLSPDLIRAALQGEVNNIPFRLVQPAEIRREAGAWRLLPVTVALRDGEARVRLAGRWGDDGLVVQSRLDSFDLSILNAYSPTLGVGGQATGSLDFSLPTGGFPRAEMRLNVENFTHTGIANRSVPVNVAIAGSLQSEAARLAGVIRQGGAVIGRVQANLAPIPAGGSWTQRLLAAPLTGGIRYNGPAEVPVSFANLVGHRVTGPIVIAADFGGRVEEPQLVGLVRASNLTYANDEFGTRVTRLAIAGRFDSSRLEITQLNGQAGRGTVTGSGSVGLAAAAGFPIDIRLQFQDAQLARSDDLGATVTGQLAVTNGPQGARIAGDIELGEARYQFVRQASTEVRELAGVRRRGEPIRAPTQEAENGVPSIWQLDLRVHANNRVFVSGMGLDSEWSADLRVGGTSATPTIVGELDLLRGELSLAGRRFQVRRGHVAFTGARPPNPRIDLTAESDIDDVEVAINVTGSSTNPQITFASTPSLPQDEVLSRILFGSSVTEISALQAVQLAASLNTLSGGGGGLNPLGQLRSAGGFTSLRILDEDETTGRGTAVAAGMYLSDRIYVEVITDARGFTATQVEVSLSRTLSVLSQFSTTNATNVNLRYSRDY